jgi:hypothetical protein
MNRLRSSCVPWMAMALAACAAAAQAGDAGLTVVRDAETGALRAPTAAEAAALQGTGRAPSGVARIVQRKMPSGAIMAEVPESLMLYSVVRVQADGSLVRSCVQGGSQASEAAQRPQFAKPMSMSTARTARGMAYEER